MWATTDALALALAAPILLAQYALLYTAATTTSVASYVCTTYKEAYFGWDKAVCFTEEQLWCRAHANMHAACLTADCRAEEVRLSLPRRVDDEGEAVAPLPTTPVFSGCTSDQVASIAAHFNVTGACVPAGDKRSWNLPECTPAEALLRSPYFRTLTV